jgi:deoxyadenosine/deoxycytidine kinase
MTRVAISGTIGVGKSTFSKTLAEAIGFSLFEEPVTENPYLEDYYKEPRKYGFSMQMFLMVHRHHRELECLRGVAQGRRYVLDRCFTEDFVFARANFELGYMNEAEFKVYLAVRDQLSRLVSPPDLMVYLRCTPEEAHRRIALRGRGMESAVSLEYLTALHKAYESLMGALERQGTRVLTVDHELIDNTPLVDRVRAVLAV